MQNVSSPHAFFLCRQRSPQKFCDSSRVHSSWFPSRRKSSGIWCWLSAAPRPYGSGFLLLRPAVFLHKQQPVPRPSDVRSLPCIRTVPSSRGAALHRIPLSLPAVSGRTRLSPLSFCSTPHPFPPFSRGRTRPFLRFSGGRLPRSLLLAFCSSPLFPVSVFSLSPVPQTQGR